MKDNYFWDKNGTRYNLARSSTDARLNWLFVPGGPGMDSSYFHTLACMLDVPGNYWLIDFPGNGDNIRKENENFEAWRDHIVFTAKKFTNPVLVGHSFGGCLGMLQPELEDLLSGFVVLNSTPSAWLEARHAIVSQLGLPPLTEELAEYQARPSEETFRRVVFSALVHLFACRNIERGRKMMENLPYNHRAYDWWIKKQEHWHYDAAWIPQALLTLIIGGEKDYVTPFSIFKKDKRFDRENVNMVEIKEGSHFCWLDKGDEVSQLISNYADSLLLDQNASTNVV